MTEADRLKWKYVPEGEKLATRYLGENADMEKELGGFDKKARPYLSQGAESVLLANIDLPRNDIVKTRNEKAMNALKLLKKDKSALNDIYEDIKRIFDHYTGQGKKQREQTYEALKEEFKGTLQKLLEKQMGSVIGVDVNVEKLPQFQEEWRRTQAQMDGQYLTLLNEYKREIKALK